MQQTELYQFWFKFVLSLVSTRALPILLFALFSVNIVSFVIITFVILSLGFSNDLSTNAKGEGVDCHQKASGAGLQDSAMRAKGV